MPQTHPQAHPATDWTVVWRDRQTGRVVFGEPVARAEAERYAEAMNRTWPEIHHWAAPLAANHGRPPLPEPGAGERVRETEEIGRKQL